MKLIYRRIYKKIDIDQLKVIRQAVAVLNAEGYKITEQTVNYVGFKYDSWAFGLTTETINKIDGGKFEVVPEESGIIFTYYLSPTLELIICIVALISGTIIDYHSFYVIAFFAIVFISRVFSTKTAAEKMLERFLNTKYDNFS